MNFVQWRKLKKGIAEGKVFDSPKAVELYLTDICNLKCTHCNIWTKTTTKPVLPYALVRSLFDECNQLGVRYVGYTGGEPLLHRDFTSILEYGKKLGFKQHVTTNATIVNQKIAQVMAKNCSSVGVSIDGVGKVFELVRRTPWENVERGLKLLVDAGANVSLGLVITALNIHNVWEVINYADEHKLSLGVQPYNKGGVVMPDGMMEDVDLVLREEHAPELQNLMQELARRFPTQKDYYHLLFDYAMHDRKRTNCYISFSKFVVEANGDVRPCHVFPVIGNIQKTSLKEIWYGNTYNVLRRQMVKCKKCYLGCYEHLNIQVNKRLGLV